MKQQPFVVVTALLVCLWCVSAEASVYTYTDSTGNTNAWSAAGTWVGGIPGINDTAVFSIPMAVDTGGGPQQTVNLGGPQSVYGMNFTGTASYTFDSSGSSNVLTVGPAGST